jgi:hypothetical protein
MVNSCLGEIELRSGEAIEAVNQDFRISRKI